MQRKSKWYFCKNSYVYFPNVVPTSLASVQNSIIRVSFLCLEVNKGHSDLKAI